MKHSLKAAVAAVALAVSAAASAQFVQGDLVVQVYDPASGDTLVAALPTTVQTAAATSAIVDSIAGYSTFTSTAGVGPSANFEYTVLGGSSGTGLGDIGYASPPNGGGPTATQTKGIFGASVQNNITQYLSTSSYAILAAGVQGAFITTNTDFGVGTITDVNDPTSLYYVSAVTTHGSTETPIDPLSFNAAAGTLTIGTSSSPTPEPGTYALMVAGLLAVGAIVRRRRA